VTAKSCKIKVARIKNLAKCPKLTVDLILTCLKSCRLVVQIFIENKTLFRKLSWNLIPIFYFRLCPAYQNNENKISSEKSPNPSRKNAGTSSRGHHVVFYQPRTQALCVVLWFAWPLRGPRGSIWSISLWGAWQNPFRFLERIAISGADSINWIYDIDESFKRITVECKFVRISCLFKLHKVGYIKILYNYIIKQASVNSFWSKST
jgi:hypothetical protein